MSGTRFNLGRCFRELSGLAQIVSFSFLCFFALNAYADKAFSFEDISPENVNLTTAKFFRSFTSKDADERKSAKLYLLGVLDATEGKSWCDYRRFKTITLRASLYDELKKLNAEEMRQPASSQIVSILSKEFPCGEGV